MSHFSWKWLRVGQNFIDFNTCMRVKNIILSVILMTKGWVKIQAIVSHFSDWGVGQIHALHSQKCAMTHPVRGCRGGSFNWQVHNGNWIDGTFWPLPAYGPLQKSHIKFYIKNFIWLRYEFHIWAIYEPDINSWYLPYKKLARYKIKFYQIWCAYKILYGLMFL